MLYKICCNKKKSKTFEVEDTDVHEELADEFVITTEDLELKVLRQEALISEMLGDCQVSVSLITNYSISREIELQMFIFEEQSVLKQFPSHVKAHSSCKLTKLLVKE